VVKWLLIFFLIALIPACRYPQELYVVEKSWWLKSIDTIYRDGSYQYKLTWINSDSMEVHLFRRAYPTEKIGTMVFWPLILPDWDK
jgi:hypothetical protein